MTKTDKLILRFKLIPDDFRWDELINVLAKLGYKVTNSGKTSGSRVKFIHADYEPIALHKPHPNKIVKKYALKQVVQVLKERGQL